MPQLETEQALDQGGGEHRQETLPLTQSQFCRRTIDHPQRRRSRMQGAVVFWTGLSVLALVDVASCRLLGLSFVNWWPFLASSGGIAALGLVYGLTGRSAKIASMANGVLLWMVFSLLAAILTYAAAALGGPLYDKEFVAADAALGFDWLAWYDFVAGHPALHLPLMIAYDSLLPQILLSVVWFSFVGWEHRSTELLTNASLSVLLTTALFHLFPSLGPCAGVAPFGNLYVDELVSLRSGSLASVDVMHLKGLFAFPSYHAVLAILFAYAHRGSRQFIPVALLNALMLVSLPSEGGHALVDVLAGGAIAGLTILATTALVQWHRLHRLRYALRASPSPFRPEGETR
jgi:hypothetical protein